jgi:phosphogluconate dehydratase
MRLVQGNLGRATFKSSAVDKERWTIEAPIRVFDTQEGVQTAFKAASWTRTSSSSSASRARAPTACPNCTS